MLNVGWLPATIIHIVSKNITGNVNLKVNTEESSRVQDLFAKRKKTQGSADTSPFYLPDYNSTLAFNNLNILEPAVEEWFSGGGGIVSNQSYVIDLSSIADILSGVHTFLFP